MKKVVVLALLTIITYSCNIIGGDRGELVGVKSRKKWYSEKPHGMVFIKGGSFTMGKQDEDQLGVIDAPTRTVTVQPFYMDETEITNSEYKQFVYYVRDSIVRTKLAQQAELADIDTAMSKDGIMRYAYAVSDTTSETPYQKYMRKNYYEVKGDAFRPLNWEEDLVWDIQEAPDENYAEVMDSVFYKKEESLNGLRTFKVELLNYRYRSVDKEKIIRTGRPRKEFIKDVVLNIYPDTTVWIKDFSYSYNDPMHQEYFSHRAYQDYPVVGVNWYQAKAFCNWRTQHKNRYQSARKKDLVPSFRLPTEAEWEYAARGGLDYAKYPWGGPSTTNDRGCFMANFKPVRGDYVPDGALYTMEAKSYKPNGFGLYNMAGNVSEWTNTSYNPMSYYFGSTMNPNVENKQDNRKITRGGSWKDVAYYMEVSSRDWEYADTARSYIGFRTVQDCLSVKK